LPLGDTNTKPNTKMTTITDTAAITEAFAKFQAGRDGAFPTSRCMPAPWDDAQEWAEYGEIEGVPAKVYYIFENADVADLEADSYDWSETSISKIEVAGKDEDGDFETL
jgi:hypothetical protein